MYLVRLSVSRVVVTSLMLLLSSAASGVCESVEDLPGNIAFETTDDLGFVLAFSDAAVDVGSMRCTQVSAVSMRKFKKSISSVYIHC
jgi:hypothetical protein